MSVLIIDQDQVRRLLSMAECIEIMDKALRTLADEDAIQPLRSLMWLPGRTSLLGLMPGYLGEPKSFGIKIITVFPGNLGTELDAHQGAVLLFDTDNGSLLAVMDATEITSIRTAAVSAVATRALAREGASVLAILGSGTQARTHLEAMLLVRPVEAVRIWSRSHDNARALARRASQEHKIDVEAISSPGQAVAGADIICTTTASNEPVLRGEWISPGAHINAVGACTPRARELDTQAVLKSRLYVDRRESALNEAGDVLIPKAEGSLGDDHILGELGEVLTGRAAGRTGKDDTTLFKSLGLAVEDLAAAHHLHHKAAHEDGTTRVDIGGRRH